MALRTKINGIMENQKVTRHFANQMVKHNCGTAADYRKMRPKVLVTVGPRRPKKEIVLPKED